MIKQDLGFVKKIRTNLINLYHFQAINHTCIKARAPASARAYSGVALQLVLGFFRVMLQLALGFLELLSSLRSRLISGVALHLHSGGLLECHLGGWLSNALPIILERHSGARRSNALPIIIFDLKRASHHLCLLSTLFCKLHLERY